MKMKTLSRFFFQLPLMAALTLLASCNFAYFEGPVPAGAPGLKTVPIFLSGEYEVIGSEAFGGSDALMRTLFRFERLDDTHLAATMESALPAGDLPKLKDALAKAQANGEIEDFFFSEKMIYYSARDTTQEGGKTGLVVHLEKRGAFYRSPQWVFSTNIFDLTKSRHIVVSAGGPGELGGIVDVPAKPELNDWHLVARGKADEVWFSSEEGPEKWSLIYLKRLSDKEIALKGTLLFDEEYFGKHQARFEAVVPFRQDDNNDFILNPSDEQLKIILADPELFGNVRLKKLAVK